MYNIERLQLACCLRSKPAFAGMTIRVKWPMEKPTPAHSNNPPETKKQPPAQPKEVGGPKGPEPTRYGDWEIRGRVSDF